MRILGAYSLTLLFAIPLSAVPPEVANAAAEVAPDPGAMDEVRAPSKTLFYRVGKPPGGPAAVRFDVHLDGQPYLTERLTLKPSDVLEPAVEFLARDPKRLASLYELSAAGNKIDISVLLNGQAMDSFTFESFVAYNEQIKSEGIHPVSTSPLRKQSPEADDGKLDQITASLTSGSCRDSCYADYDYCIYANCEPYVYNYWCSRCDDTYYSCLNNCPCEDQVSYTTRKEVVNSYDTGWAECLREWAYRSILYKEVAYSIKNTKYKVTTHCDGTTTEEPVEVWYNYQTCFRSTGGICFYPSRNTYNAVLCK